MPCKSDYLNPLAREAELHRTAKLLVYALTSLGRPVPPDVATAADSMYCKTDLVPDLCALVRSMTPEQLDKVVYDGHNEQARELATWWDRHQKADTKRQAREATKRTEREIVAHALYKLSSQEVAALRSWFKEN